MKRSRDVAAAPLKLFFEPTLDNYRAVLFNQYSADSALARVRVDIPGSFMNSMIIAGGATILAMALGNLAAFALAKYKMPERDIYACLSSIRPRSDSLAGNSSSTILTSG